MPDKPPFDPSMSDGCSLPYWLRSCLGVIDRQYVACRDYCVAHDEAYYNGGTEEEREAADAALRDAIAPVVGDYWAQEWYVALRMMGGTHWGTGRTWDGRKMWEGANTEAP